jgi:hypothetical protein
MAAFDHSLRGFEDGCAHSASDIEASSPVGAARGCYECVNNCANPNEVNYLITAK